MSTNPARRLQSAKNNRIKTLPSTNQTNYSTKKPKYCRSIYNDSGTFSKSQINWKNIKESLASNPDIYFRPQVKKQAYICVIDKYLAKNPDHQNKAKPRTPINSFKKNIFDRSGTNNVPIFDNQQTSEIEKLRKQSAKTNNQTNAQKQKTFSSSLLAPKAKPFLRKPLIKSQQSFSEDNVEGQKQKKIQPKLPTIEQTNHTQDDKKLKIKRSITINISNENPQGNHHQVNYANPHYNHWVNHKKNGSEQSFGQQNDQQSFESFPSSLIELDSPEVNRNRCIINKNQVESQQTDKKINFHQVNYKRMLAMLFQTKNYNSLYTIVIKKADNFCQTFNEDLRQNSKKSFRHNYKSRLTMRTNFMKTQEQLFLQTVQTKKFNLHQNTSEEDKIHKMINAIQKASDLGVPTFWKAQIGWKGVYEAPLKKCLRNELFSFTYDQKNMSKQIIRIIPKKAYQKLFENNCEYLSDIIEGITKQLIKIKGRIITNNLNLDNIYMVDEKDIRIGEWGYSAVKRVLEIGGKNVQLVDDPVINDQNGWLINPESLAPEIVQNIYEGTYTKIWEQNPTAEVWNIGLMIFEILSVVPVWMPNLASFSHKLARKGLFYDRTRKLDSIRQAQQKFPFYICKWIREQKHNLKRVRPQILTIMKQCLQIKPSKRIKYQQILNLLCKN